MKSALYPCCATHLRLRPSQHRLEHEYFLFATDLSELETEQSRLLGLYKFRANDFLYPEPKNATFTEKLDRAFAEFETSRPSGQTLFLGLPRVAGYLFNPVCFFFHFDPEGNPEACLIQVGNTFGEYKLFLLTEPEGDRFKARKTKHFYVSPFAKSDSSFDFDIRVPSETLKISINTIDEEGPLIYADLTGRKISATTANLIWQTVRCPFVSAKVIFLIHWHALWLYLKGITPFSKRATLNQQKDILRPHSHD